MKKRLLTIVLALAATLCLCVGLAACGEGGGGACGEGGGGADQTPDAVYKTVSFYLDETGSSVWKEMRFEVGQPMREIPKPTKDGYRFVAWKDYFGREYNAASVMPEGDLRLFALWEKTVTSYEDDYISLKPASEGCKDPAIRTQYGNSVDKYVYVELTSDDLGGVSHVGTENNFSLRTLDSMEYKVKSGYTWMWYWGNLSTPNGGQQFSLNYGSNIQLITISDGSGVVQQTYLLDIYVRYDYYIKLYTDIFAEQPYKTIRVVENERFDANTPVYAQGQYSKLEFDSRKYYNGATGKYEDFVYSTPIRDNWSLYQTYKPFTVSVNLNGGTMSENITVTPYTKNLSLPLPQKAGCDFLGWQWTDGTYFSDITGYLGVNYLSAENAGMELKAVYADKQFIYHSEQDGDTEKHIVRETIPVVTYTDETQSEILEITYVPRGTYVSPEKTPFREDKIFINWQSYDHKTGAKVKIPYDKPVTEPLALFANEESATYFSSPSAAGRKYNVVPLNGERTFSGSSTGIEYRANLPTDGEYTLEITTTGSVTVNMSRYGATAAQSYTATSSSPQTIKLKFTGAGSATFPDGGYITFSVTDLSGTFTTRLIGATARTEEAPEEVGDSSVLSYGEELELHYSKVQDAKLGYVFAWKKDGEILSDDETYTLRITEECEIRVGYLLVDGMEQFEFTSGANSCEITGVKDKTVTNIIIPSFVTSIEKGAFSGCSSLKEITIPFVGQMKTHPFMQNRYFGYIFGASGSSDQSIFIPASLRTVVITGGTSIGSYAFSGCSGLTSVTIPDSVKSIGEWAFRYCNSLERVNITDLTAWCKINFGNSDANPLDYAHHLYKDGVEITELVVPDEITEIKGYVFSGCSGLTSIVIPDSVTSIGRSGLSGCSGLMGVTIGSGVTSIGDYAFHGCNKLENITVSSGNANYSSQDGILYDKQKTEFIHIPKAIKGNVTIPDSVTEIGSYAFSGCSELMGVTIGSGVTSIGDYAFAGCNKLENITVASGNANYSSQDGILYNKQKTKFIHIPKAIKGNVTIPDGVTSIGSYESGFSGCSELMGVTIGSGVTSIGYNAFYGCNKLENITVASGNANYSSQDGILYDKQKTEFIHIPKAIKGNVTIPDGVTSIGSSAFEGCSGLTSVTIGSGVTSIGYNAFYGCSGLTSVTIGSGVTSIGSSAFKGCSGLTSVTIGSGVTSIGYNAFYGCHKLVEVWDHSALNIQKGDTGNGYVGCYALNVYKVDEESKVTTTDVGYIFYENGDQVYLLGYTGEAITLTLPDTSPNGKNYAIYEYAFYECSGLTSVTIPDSVTSIGESAFEGCSGLTSVTIPDSVKSIGESAFRYCNSLERVNITDLTAWCKINFGKSYANPLYYAHHLYKDGVEITELVVPDEITEIKGYAFYECSGLTSVTIPDSVKSIGESAFEGCSGLMGVTIGSGVTSIGRSAFYGCHKLVEVWDHSALHIQKGDVWDGYVGYYALNVYKVDEESKVTTTDEGYIFYENRDQAYLLGYTGGAITLTLPDTSPNGKKYAISQYAFEACSGLTSIVIPDSVTSIGSSAFSGCSGLTSVTIGSGVTSIGSSAFYGCNKLENITVASGNANYSSQDGILYNKQKTKFIHIPKAIKGNVTIPDSVTSIGSYAFSGCSGLMGVTIGSGVTSIGDYAFKGCSSLTRVTFANTSGWKVSTSVGMSSAQSISVRSPETAAQYLTSTYVKYYWKRY